MKEIVKKYIVYEYEELEKEVQKKLLDEKIEECENAYLDFVLNDDIIFEAKKILKEYFGENAIFKNVYYDFSYSQGSGAMIEFVATYNKKRFEVKKDGIYCHERSFNIEEMDILTNDEYKRLKEKIIKMNIKLYFSSKKFLNSNFSEEAKEILKQYNFLKDGSIIE